MAKGIGLIGNFRGKVGNMVGYNLKDSNNKQTQGVRVYQPVVKNPKTYGQAEQRAKLAPINATYRALKAIIDRGQEGKAYGNKSRLAWLSDAMKAFNGGWFDKGAAITMPALVPLTKGSLGVSIPITDHDTGICISLTGATVGTTTKVGQVSTLLLSQYPFLKEGDQITFVIVGGGASSLQVQVESLVIDSNSNDNLPSGISVLNADELQFSATSGNKADAIIISREGTNGAHLRNTVALFQAADYDSDSLAPAAKEAAIKSYMAAGANTDWAEESLQ